MILTVHTENFKKPKSIENDNENILLFIITPGD